MTEIVIKDINITEIPVDDLIKFNQFYSFMSNIDILISIHIVSSIEADIRFYKNRNSFTHSEHFYQEKIPKINEIKDLMNKGLEDNIKLLNDVQKIKDSDTNTKILNTQVFVDYINFVNDLFNYYISLKDIKDKYITEIENGKLSEYCDKFNNISTLIANF
jgi:hypothetical protein